MIQIYKNIKMEEIEEEFKKLKLKKDLGQYFTKNRTLLKKVNEFILNKPELILEPSIGRGDIVNYIKENRWSFIIFPFYLKKEYNYLYVKKYILLLNIKMM